MKRLTTLAIILLAAMNVLTFIYSSQVTGKINELTQKVENATNKTIVFEGKNGYTPVKGIDYNDGKDGINAMSYSFTNTIIKEIPLIGQKGDKGEDGHDGKDGLDAPYQQLRLNSESGDLESKLSSDKYWTILVPCAEIKTGCKE